MHQICKRPRVMDVDDVSPLRLLPIGFKHCRPDGARSWLQLQRHPNYITFRQRNNFLFRHSRHGQNALLNAELRCRQTNLPDCLFKPLPEFRGNTFCKTGAPSRSPNLHISVADRLICQKTERVTRRHQRNRQNALQSPY